MDERKKYVYMDESGDPEFYGNRGKLLVGEEGYTNYLMLGMVVTENKKNLRRAILNFSQRLKGDPLYSSIHTFSKPGWYLHAKDDHPDIRSAFFQFLRRQKGFKIYIILGRKDISIFQNLHQGKPRRFYFDLVSRLLRKAFGQDEKGSYQFFLSQRGKNNNEDFDEAIKKALKNLGEAATIQCNIVRSQDEPICSVIDYFIWALQRFLNKGEKRFLESIIGKIEWVVDSFEFEENPDGSLESAVFHARTILEMKPL